MRRGGRRIPSPGQWQERETQNDGTTESGRRLLDEEEKREIDHVPTGQGQHAYAAEEHTEEGKGKGREKPHWGEEVDRLGRVRGKQGVGRRRAF